MGIKLVLVFALIAYGISHYVGGKPAGCPPMPVTCICKEYTQYLTMETRYEMNEDYGRVVCATIENPFKVCDRLGCLFYDPDMESPPKDFIPLNSMETFYPIGFVLPSEKADYDQGHHRSPRRLLLNPYLKSFPKPCYMKPLYSANVACWNWGHFFSCNVTCIPGYGHTVDGRSVRSWTTKCRFLENFWYPREYDNCEPVGRNCDVEMTGSGTLKCTSPTEEHRYCDIECYADIFLDTGNVSVARYPCTSDNYANELPWCATLRNVSVIEEPDYPYEDIYTYTGNYY